MLNVRNAPFTYNDAIFSGILRPRCKNDKKAPTAKPWELLICKSVGHIGQESDLTGSLDSLGELALMHCAGTGSTTGKDLAALGNVAAKLCSILIVDAGGLIYAKLADFSALAVFGIVLIESH